jgi:DNA-binding FrmR family transcriptional regulator
VISNANRAESRPDANAPASQVEQSSRRSGLTIIEMIENDRPCLLIAQQLQAVESAIESAKKALIHDHISACLERPLKTAGSSGRALKEFKLIAKYL